jgi:hypothetical protein
VPLSQIYFGRKLYMFRAVPQSIIRSFSLYTHSSGVCHTGFQRAHEQDQAGQPEFAQSSLYEMLRLVKKYRYTQPLPLLYIELPAAPPETNTFVTTALTNSQQSTSILGAPSRLDES